MLCLCKRFKTCAQHATLHVTHVAAQSMAGTSTCPFYTLRKAEFLIGTGGLVSLAACSGRTFSLTPLKILRACALTFSTLSNVNAISKCNMESQSKKLTSFHQESLTLKRNCLEILLLFLGVLFLVILVFLFSFLFILWHFNLLQGSIWIHTKLLRHQLVHMAHK